MSLPLEGCGVVDLSVGIPGAYATKLLADGGASVVKVEPPGGDPLRRWSASGADVGAAEGGVLFQYLAGGKQSVAMDPDRRGDVERVWSLVARADAVVWSPGSALTALPELRVASLRAAAPHAVVVAITAVGLDGPWAEQPHTDLTLQAWAGTMSTQGSPERPPVAVGGDLHWWAAGAYAAAGLLAARRRVRRTGVGELLDVSVLEAMAASDVPFPVTYFDVAGRPMREERMLNFPGIERTKDGFVGFMIFTGQQWHDFCVLVEHPEWMDDPDLLNFERRVRRRTELGPFIRSWMEQHTTAEVLELADALRVPAAPVGTGATVVDADHFVATGAFVRSPSGFLQPDVFYRSPSLPRSSPRSSPGLGEHDAGDGRRLRPWGRSDASPARREVLPLEGLRVVELGAYWAGPMLGQFLGMLGADVVKVESTVRPDGFRTQSVKSLREDLWWEWAPLYAAVNTNKRGVTLDLTSSEGRELARKLIGRSDVVIENFSPRVVEGMGLAWDEVHELNPSLVMVRMPAYGLDGPWRDRPGFAQTVEQACGMAWLTGFPDGEPQVPNSFCDPVGATHAAIALMLALDQRDRTGEGVLVEVPLVSAALSVAAEPVVEYSAHGFEMGRLGNRARAPGVVQNVYRAAGRDDRDRADLWVAIAVESDEQWQALGVALGAPAWTARPDLATGHGRRRSEDEIDQRLAEWCSSRPPDEIVSALTAAGVPVARVQLPHELGTLHPLVARDFFETVDHPVVGEHRCQRFPVLFADVRRRLHRRAAPRLGEHNVEVLQELGLGAEDIAELEQRGVIGSRPRS